MRDIQPPAEAGQSTGQSGYNLVVMVIAITVLNVMVATALPLWSHVIQRDKEEELIFRGLQYAEAIRVFQTRHQRLPIRLEELMEVKPRSIRKLWQDPMTEDGKWGLLVATQARPGQGQQQGGRQRPANPRQGRILAIPSRPRGRGDAGGPVVTTGPLQGVFSNAEGTAAKTFFGETEYSQWQFTVDMLQFPTNPDPNAPLPRITSAWIGRPFRNGLQPQLGPQGRGPGAQNLQEPNPGQPRGPGVNPGRPGSPATGINPRPPGNPQNNPFERRNPQGNPFPGRPPGGGRRGGN